MVCPIRDTQEAPMTIRITRVAKPEVSKIRGAVTCG